MLYWLLRALDLGPADAMAARALYCIGESSIAIVNLRGDESSQSMKVITIGDTGHLPVQRSE